MASYKTGRLLMHYEAAELLNLTILDIRWLIDTRQLHETTIRAKKRLGERDVNSLLTFHRRLQDRRKHHAGHRSIQIL